MAYMKTCVYDLAAGSDMAVNETQVAREQDDASRAAMVEACLSRVLDAPTTDNATHSPEPGCSVFATTGQADTTIAPDLAERNSAPSRYFSLNPMGSGTVWTAVSEPGDSPGPKVWESSPIWGGNAKPGSTGWTGSDGSSTDWTASEAEEGSSSCCRDSDAGSDGTGNPSGGVGQVWCPASDPVWSPAADSTATRTDSDARSDDAAHSSRGSGHSWSPLLDPVCRPAADSAATRANSDDARSENTAHSSGWSELMWYPSLDPVWPQVTENSTTRTDPDARSDDDMAHSSGWSEHNNWCPELDPVWPPVAESAATRTDADARSDDETTDSRGLNPDCPELDPVSSPAAEPMSCPGQEPLELDPIWGGTVEEILSSWGGSVEDFLSSWTAPDVKENDDTSAYSGGGKEPGVDGAVWTLRVAEWFSCCRSRVASCVAFPSRSSVCQLINLCSCVATLAVLLYQNGLAETDCFGAFR